MFYYNEDMVSHHSIFKTSIEFNSHKYYQFLGHIQSSETFNGTLLILSAVKSDSGNYKCVADTASHYVTSAPALVKVIGKIMD